MGRLLRGSGRLVPAVVFETHAEATTVLDRARAEADAILASARTTAEAARAAAVDEGRAQGRLAGEAAFVTLLAAARAQAERVRAGARDAARTIAVKMAEKILGRELALDPGAVVQLAAAALDACRARDGVVELRAHPQDLAALDAQQPRLLATLAEGATLTIVADEAIARGGCLVQTPVGRIDGRLDVQVAALADAVFGAAGEGGGGRVA